MVFLTAAAPQQQMPPWPHVKPGFHQETAKQHHEDVCCVDSAQLPDHHATIKTARKTTVIANGIGVLPFAVMPIHINLASIHPP